MWNDAAHLEIRPTDFPWEKFSWQKAIIHFTRLIGFVHIGNLDSARAELKKLNILHDSLIAEREIYKANQVEIQVKASGALILSKEGKNNAALDLMDSAVYMEDATEKHPVTPGQVVPARELLGNMLLEMGYYTKALIVYQEDLRRNPNRFNALYSAGLAAQKSGDKVKAKFYYKQLTDQSVANSARSELSSAKLFLNQ
jgi:tetratricopeptide (TPR) repeat protein